MDRPPYRADHVGSLLRPPELVDARARRARGELAPEALRAIEDEAIRRVVRRQEEVGLRGVTDGEFRRTYFHVDFLEQLDGVTVAESGFTATFRRDDGTEVGFKPPTVHVTAAIRHRHPIQGRDFDFLAGVTTRTPKVCIPSPSMLHFRGGRRAISESVYPELDAFYADLAAAYRAEIGDLAGRGCRYLQMDDTNLAYLCDDKIREATRARGDDPDELPRLYCRLINDAIAGRPDDMAVCVHLCRGNYRSAWVAQGGYEPVAEILFNELAIDGFFLEYDDWRSGDFAPLRFMPKGKVVVLGVMTSKRAELESKDALKRRIEEASRYVSLDQLALSPQCGFASTAHGNLMTEDDQWRKLGRVVEVAREVWGEV
ncbi:MAG TPA: 5-methyltetrahydropteroyltriglutamate--homocysteine S-methyltransferase [Thermoleophilaceae bacterium]|nr:5-methyltetrahydropteroyltriglutamate--homocysteine S-methyltransferase [Thermoleophilaceae bacterium]